MAFDNVGRSWIVRAEVVDVKWHWTFLNHFKQPWLLLDNSHVAELLLMLLFIVSNWPLGLEYDSSYLSPLSCLVVQKADMECLQAFLSLTLALTSHWVFQLRSTRILLAPRKQDIYTSFKHFHTFLSRKIG